MGSDLRHSIPPIQRQELTDAGTEGNQRDLVDEFAAVAFVSMIGALCEPAKSAAHKRSDDAVAALVILNHLHGLGFFEKTVRGSKALKSDSDFFVGICLDVAQPVAIWAKAIGDDQFRAPLPVFDHFQHGVTP